MGNVRAEAEDQAIVFVETQIASPSAKRSRHASIVVLASNYDVQYRQSFKSRYQRSRNMTPIEEQIARLEKAVFGEHQEPSRDDWQKSVGMFRGDPVMQEILDDVRKARDRERELSRLMNDQTQ